MSRRRKKLIRVIKEERNLNLIVPLQDSTVELTNNKSTFVTYLQCLVTSIRQTIIDHYEDSEFFLLHDYMKVKKSLTLTTSNKTNVK